MSGKIESTEHSRRDFIKSATLLSAVGVAGTTAGCSALSDGRSWAREADALIVGTGAAGMAAAIAVIRAGGSVLLLEKGGVTGGTSAKSAGAYWIPNNHHLRSSGKTDPKPEAIAYMARDAYPAKFKAEAPKLGLADNEYALIEAYYDNAAAVIEDLEKIGAIKSTVAPVYDYMDHTSANKVPRGRALLPLRSDGKWGRGVELVRQLKAWLTAKQATFLVHHDVAGVERNARGEVVGLRVNTPDGQQFFRARKGIVFATGGYSQNRHLLESYQLGNIYGACSVPTAQGDFLRIGGELGAMMGNMSSAWRSEVVVEQTIESPSVAVTLEFPAGDSMIIVNGKGKRVNDEKRNYNIRGRDHFYLDPIENDYPNDLLYMVFDQRTLELFAGNMSLPAPGTTESYVITADSLDGLGAAIQARLDRIASKIGKRALADDFTAGLKAQVAIFSRDARTGVDTQFQRGKYPYDIDWHTIVDSVPVKGTKWPPNTLPNPTMYPFADTGPYHAIILGGGMLDTNGGPVINAKSQVLDTAGKPIPGLYGAGNCVASPNGGGYWGAGATLGPGMTFGTLAGRHVVAESIKDA